MVNRIPFRLSRWIPCEPTPVQAAFLCLGDLEALYGGAAGGGKSVALLMAALQFSDVPGFSALLLRRTFRDLSQPEGLIDLSHQWLGGTGAAWNDRDKRWRFPEGGSLTFGYLETEGDKYQYQGAAFQFIGFDELTQFTRTQYLYLLSRLRKRTTLDVPLRMRAASNPGGEGHEWVKQRFVDPGGDDRPFVPAKLADNPHLDQESYRRSLARLDSVTREQLEDGNWNARHDGSLFRRDWFNVVDEAPADGIKWVRRWDMAATKAEKGKDPDWCVGAKIGLRDGRWTIANIRRTRGTPLEVERLVEQTAKLDGTGLAIRMEQEPGSSGKTVIDHYQRRVLTGYDFKGIPSTGEKSARWRPLASAAQAGNVDIVRGPWNEAFLDEVEAAPNGAHDDQLDAVSGGMVDLALPEPGVRVWVS